MKFIATLVSLLICSGALTQSVNSDTSFACIANWKKGEEKRLLIQRSKTTSQSDFNFSYEAAVTVLDSSKEGYKMQWVFHLPEEVKRAEPGLAAQMPVYEGLKMVFTTSPVGTFNELLNWEEVRDAYVKMMEVSLPKKMDEKTTDALNKAKEMFGTKQMVEAALIKEIILYHVIYGGFFTKSGSTEKTSLPSPFSSDQIPAVISARIVAETPWAAGIKITTDQQIDMAGAGKMFEELFRKMNIPEDSVMEKAKVILAGFEIKDHSEYTVAPVNGWMKKVEYLRTARTEEMERKESFIITMKE